MIRETASKLNFPEEAILTFEKAYEILLASPEAVKISQELSEWVFTGENGDYSQNFKLAETGVKKLAEACGVHLYTINMVFWLMCADKLKDIYSEKGLSEELYFGTMADLKYKLDECMKNHGVWGTFTFWYKSFFTLDRFGFGRLQYDVCKWSRDDYYNGFVKEGDLVFGCHIPPCGPLYPDAVIDSLKKLYNHFKDELKEGILVVRCSTWLLYPPITDLCKENSNIRKFSDFFDIIDVDHRTANPYSDFWRIFAMPYEGPQTLLKVPTDTSFRRSMKKFIQDGGSIGAGFGVILFDGEKIVNKN